MAAREFGPFSFVDAISETKEDVMTPEVERLYEPFVTGRHLSYFPDAVLYANEVNKYPDCPKAMHYAYLFGSVKARKRRTKWTRADHAQADRASAVFGVSRRKARDVLSILDRHGKLGELAEDDDPVSKKRS